MRRIGDLLKDLGFNADAPMSTQKAFLRHLAAAAAASDNSRQPPPPPPVKTGQQLSFDPDVLGLLPSEPRSKKA